MWAPRQFIPLQLSLAITSVLASLPPSWSYSAIEYDSTHFGDGVAAARVCIQFVARSSMPDVSCHSPMDRPHSTRYSFGCFIYPSYDDDVATTTLPVSDEIISSLECNHHHPPDFPLTLNPDGYASAILHPYFLAAEPLLSGYAHPYGQRFGIPLEIRTGWCKSTVISPPELLLYYSIPQQSLQDTTSWSSKGKIIISLLPGALPYRLAAHAARSNSRLNTVYDSFTYVD